MCVDDDENRHKRRVWRRLGPSYVFFFFLVYYILTNISRFFLSTF